MAPRVTKTRMNESFSHRVVYPRDRHWGLSHYTQPGTSVATNLVEGEAVRKKVGILDIQGKNFRLHPVPLTQVRSFVTTGISLKETNSMPRTPRLTKRWRRFWKKKYDSWSCRARKRCNKCARMPKRPATMPERTTAHSIASWASRMKFWCAFAWNIRGSSRESRRMLLFHREKEVNAHAKAIKKCSCFAEAQRVPR
jgi:hypothetical protein